MSTTGDKVDRAVRLYAQSLGLLEAYASALYLHMGNQADTEVALDIIVEPSIYSGGIAALSNWQYAGSIEGLMAEMGRRDAQRIVKDLAVMGKEPVVLLSKVLAALEPGRHAGRKHAVTKQAPAPVALPKQLQASGHKRGLKKQQTAATGRPAAGARVITAPRRPQMLRNSKSTAQTPIRAGAGVAGGRQGLAAQPRQANAQSAAKKVPSHQELLSKQKALFDQAAGTSVKLDMNPYAALSSEEDSDFGTQTGAEEGSHATERAGSSSSSQTALGVVAEPFTAEPEAELTAAVEELATACSSRPSTQEAAEGACPAVAEPVVISSAPSSAVSSAATGSKRAAASQAAIEPVDPGAAPPDGDTSEGPGISSGEKAPTSPAQETRMLLPNGQSHANLTLDGISKEGSKAASMFAEPAAQEQQAPAAVAKESNSKMGQGESGKPATQSVADTEAVLPGQQPSNSKSKGKAGKGKVKTGKGKRKPGKRRKGASSPASGPTAMPLEEVVIDMAAAQHAEHPPIRAADVAGVGQLLAQQDPAGYGGKASLTDAEVATSETATIGGNSRTNQAASCPAADAEHSCEEQQPARLMEPTCNKAKNSKGTVNAVPLTQLTSNSAVVDVPAVRFHSRPAGMPDAATPKLPGTGETGAKGSHHPTARPGSQAGMSAPITGASKSEPKVEEGQPPCGSVPAPQASISGSVLPSGQARPAGTASARRAASRERPTWTGRAALFCNFLCALLLLPLFLLCFFFGGDRPLSHNYQAGQNTAAPAKSGAGHHNSSSSAFQSSAPSWRAEQSAAAAAVGSPVAFSAAATPAASQASVPLSHGSTLGQQAGSRAPTAASTATSVALPEQAAMVMRSPAFADQPWHTSQVPAAAAAGQLAGAALHQAASHADAGPPAAQAPRQAPAASPGASRKLIRAQEPPAAQLQGTSRLAWSAVPALDASSRAAGAEKATSANSSVPTSSPAVAVQDARSAVAAAEGAPPGLAEPAAVQAASSSLGAAVGKLHDAAAHIAQLSLNRTRSSVVTEALGMVSVLARHNAWLVEEAVKTLQGTNEAAIQGLRHAVKDPLAAALRRAAAAEREAAAAEKAVATVTAEVVALAQHNKQLVQQLAEANAARAEAEQRLRAARLEPAAGRDDGAAAQQPEGSREQDGHRHEQTISEAPVAAQRMAAKPMFPAGDLGA